MNAPAPASSGHILVVEGNDVTRKLITGILGKNGYSVFEAKTGDAAVAFLAKPLHMVLLDLSSADASTRGLVRKMQLKKSKLPLVVMTEDTDTEGVKKNLGIPQAGILTKPITPDALMRLIEDHILADAIGGEEEVVRLKTSDGPDADEREKFMRRAIDLSQEMMDRNCGGPFGAVVVKNGKIIGEGWNQVTSSNDPTAHAEIMAIRQAAGMLKDFSLKGCELYTSCEPCPMCLSAIYWARLDRVYYANTRQDAEKIGFDDEFIYREIPLPENKRSLPLKMMLHDEAKIVFENWVKKKDKVNY